MNIEQIYAGCLAQGAYYITSNGEATIIDPLRETIPTALFNFFKQGYLKQRDK